MKFLLVCFMSFGLLGCGDQTFDPNSHNVDYRTLNSLEETRQVFNNYYDNMKLVFIVAPS